VIVPEEGAPCDPTFHRGYQAPFELPPLLALCR
jgi:hypothetical protein